MTRLAVSILVLLGSSAASAGTLTCTLSNAACTDCLPTTASFFIDPTLGDGRSGERRASTMVTFGTARFAAEPILMRGGIRGFHEVGPNDAERLMIVQADGQATYIETITGQTLTGTCTDSGSQGNSR